MTPRNFTCIAKGHFLLEFVMYLLSFYYRLPTYLKRRPNYHYSMSTLQGPDHLY